MITKHTPENDLHAWLREQTRTRHQTLDRSPLLNALLQPGLDPDTYVRCLRHLHAAHASTEAWPVTHPQRCQPISRACPRCARTSNN